MTGGFGKAPRFGNRHKSAEMAELQDQMSGLYPLTVSAKRFKVLDIGSPAPKLPCKGSRVQVPGVHGSVQEFKVRYTVRERAMTIHKMLLMTGSIVTMFLAARVTAQQPPPAQQANPSPGCTATPAQLEANKKVAMEFFRTTGEARVALADPTYKQHNPAFKKRAEDNKVSDYEEFKNAFL